MSLHALAGHMASKGRGSDSMLVHMTPEEVQSLQVLALKGGGTLTINPDTGLPEANFLKKMLPMIAGFALAPLTAGTSLAFLGATPLASAMTVGGITGLATGSLSRGLMAGLGAYGGASLGAGLAGAGAGAAQSSAMAGLTGEQLAQQAAAQGLTEQGVLNQAAAEATKNFAASGAGSQLAQGATAALNNPKALMSSLGGPMGTFKTAYAAATPILAGEMVPTTTQMPDSKQTPSYIRAFDVDPYTQRMQALMPFDASKVRLPSTNMAQGGIVALAEGGTPGGVVTPGSIEELYRKYAGRGSDPSGLQYWQQQFGDTIDPNEINIFKTAVAEARGLGTEPVDVTRAQANTLVENMYRNVLNRDAEQSGLNYWADMIQTSNDPTKVYNDFLTAAKAGTELGKFNMGYEQAVKPFQGYTSADTGSTADEWVRNVLGREVTAADRNQQWYKDMGNVTSVAEAKDAYNDFLQSTGAKTDLDWMAASQLAPLAAPVQTGKPTTTTVLPTNPQTNAPPGTRNPYGNINNPGDLTLNPDGTTTVTPNIPGRPYGGFSGMSEVKDAYTAGGGSLGYTPYAPKTLQEFQDSYTNTGGSKQAYDFLMNKGAADIKRPITKTGELMLPYAEVMGLRRPGQIVMPRKPAENNAAAGGVMHMALGGLGALAGGGQAGYNLGGYSDGGRLLRGPGDGVSDSIPATIGDKQPARLADGEFVVPARIVSELGNGSTEAGARKLYAMMDRVQKARGKTTGKNRVAANTRSEKFLPA
jgi:hypothetical protein